MVYHQSRGLSISTHLGDLDPAVHGALVHLISFSGHHHETATDRVERVRHGHRTGSDDLQQNNPELSHKLTSFVMGFKVKPVP